MGTVLARLRWWALALVLCAGAAAAGDLSSEVETLLFETDHLANVKGSAKLLYTYNKAGSLEEPADDKVELRVVPLADGTKSVSVQFLTGVREVSFPPVQHARGSPLLLYFLERDIREMKRLTGGQPLYFQRLIRKALEGATARAATISYKGRKVPAREISITPYAGDPGKARYEKLAAKRYVFTLCDEVPGGIYRIGTSVAAGEKILLEESLTFSAIAKAN